MTGRSRAAGRRRPNQSVQYFLQFGHAAWFPAYRTSSLLFLVIIIIIIKLFFPLGRKSRHPKTCLNRAGLSRRETLVDYRRCCPESAAKDALGATKTD